MKSHPIDIIKILIVGILAENTRQIREKINGMVLQKNDDAISEFFGLRLLSQALQPVDIGREKVESYPNLTTVVITHDAISQGYGINDFLKDFSQVEMKKKPLFVFLDFPSEHLEVLADQSNIDFLSISTTEIEKSLDRIRPPVLP